MKKAVRPVITFYIKKSVKRMDGKTKGIIIRATDYRESDRILDVFTPEGIVAVVAKGVRSPSAKLKN